MSQSPEVRPVAADDAPAPQPSNGRRPPIALIVIGVLAIAGIAFGAKQYVWGRSHIRTDNAQVEGHVIPVLAKVSGYVTAVAVVENQLVKEGDELVRLDDREYRDKVAQADADLAAARAMAGQRGQVGQTGAQLAAARDAVTQARANAARARADVQRYRELAPRGVISRQQLDAAEATAAAANAQLDATQKQVLAAQAAMSGADARLAASKAARDAAALNVGWTRIVAPHTGTVSRKTVEVGQLVSPGQPLMTVVPLDDVWVVANLKETEVRDIRPGAKAEIEVDAYPHHVFPAHVESLSPATGARFSLLPPDNATGNFTKVVQRIPVRLRLDGVQDAQHPLRPGMSVQATVITN